MFLFKHIIENLHVDDVDYVVELNVNLFLYKLHNFDYLNFVRNRHTKIFRKLRIKTYKFNQIIND